MNLIEKDFSDFVEGLSGSDVPKSKPINHKYLLNQTHIENYIHEGNYTIDDVRKQIQNKECKLSSSLRKFFMDNYKAEE